MLVDIWDLGLLAHSWLPTGGPGEVGPGTGLPGPLHLQVPVWAPSAFSELQCASVSGFCSTSLFPILSSPPGSGGCPCHWSPLLAELFPSVLGFH